MMIALRRRRDASSTIDLPSPAAVRPSEERISGRRKRAVSLVLKDNTPKDLTMTEWPTGAASLFRGTWWICTSRMFGSVWSYICVPRPGKLEISLLCLFVVFKARILLSLQTLWFRVWLRINALIPWNYEKNPETHP